MSFNKSHRRVEKSYLTNRCGERVFQSKRVEFFLISWILILETFILVPGCGGNLGATSQDNTFTSPGYPNGYANNLNCLWVITTLPGNRIWLNLTNLDIEGHFTCSFDRIIIYDSECFLWLSFHCFMVTTKLETCVNCIKVKKIVISYNINSFIQCNQMLIRKEKLTYQMF